MPSPPQQHLLTLLRVHRLREEVGKLLMASANVSMEVYETPTAPDATVDRAFTINRDLGSAYETLCAVHDELLESW